MDHKQYSKAPIVEAIIDIQVKMAEEFSYETLGAVHANLSDRFPTKSSIQRVQMGVVAVGQASAQPQLSSSTTDIGLRLSSEDNSRILQLRANGLTYGQMPPYVSWDVLRKDARDAWLVFVKLCKPRSVVRCAVRFINRVDVPKPSIELRDYFGLYPEIPKGIPQDVSGMFMQLQMPQQDLDSMAIINQAVAEPVSPGTVSVLLDFDLFRLCDYVPDDEAIWDYLDTLRNRKNKLFEACITDETRRLIE